MATSSNANMFECSLRFLTGRNIQFDRRRSMPAIVTVSDRRKLMISTGFRPKQYITVGSLLLEIAEDARNGIAKPSILSVRTFPEE